MILKIKSKRHGIQHVIIDREDLVLIKKYTWRITKGRTTFYVIAYNKKNVFGSSKTIKIGHVILGHPSKIVIDHANCNGLDNRKRNLRVATYTQNGANRRKLKLKSSKFKGVTWKKSEQFWVCRLRIHGKIIYGGGFNSEVHAAKKYNDLAIQYFGRFARLNVFSKKERTELKMPSLKKKSLFKRNVTGYVGVSRGSVKRRGRPFIATIYVDGKNKSLGTFDTAQEAAIAYNKASLKYRGKHGYQNKIS